MFNRVLNTPLPKHHCKLKKQSFEYVLPNRFYRILYQNDESITDPIKITNIFNNFPDRKKIFNNFFSTKAAKTKSKLKKPFSDFFKTKNLVPTFLFIQQLRKIFATQYLLQTQIKQLVPSVFPWKFYNCSKRIFHLNLMIFLIFQLQLVSFLQILNLHKTHTKLKTHTCT